MDNYPKIIPVTPSYLEHGQTLKTFVSRNNILRYQKKMTCFNKSFFFYCKVRFLLDVNDHCSFKS